MPAVVKLSDKVPTVRQKIGLHVEFHTVWRLLNTAAQDICYETYGPTTITQANTVVAIRKLKALDFRCASYKNVVVDEVTVKKIEEVLAIEGFTVWLVQRVFRGIVISLRRRRRWRSVRSQRRGRQLGAALSREMGQ